MTRTPLEVALVSSALGSRCGIAEHSRMLMDAVGDADPGAFLFQHDPAWLDPQAYPGPSPHDVVLLNYHRGLHSRWTSEVVERYAPTPFVVVFHDTYETQPDSLPWDLLACENVRAMIVHEACDLSTPSVDNPHMRDGREHALKVHYWRQPCPLPGGRGHGPIPTVFHNAPWCPTLGTLGFDFPWKNYDLLAAVTADCGWNLRIVGDVPEVRQAELRAINPRTVCDGFLSSRDAIGALSACDATAFMYTCQNSGTSAAIRLGITAARPLAAAEGCRQFRDLTGFPGIDFIPPTHEGLSKWLLGYTLGMWPLLQGYRPQLITLAHVEGWARYGAKYAALLQDVATSSGVSRG